MDQVRLNMVSAVDAVCRALEDDIFHLRYPPGAKITEADLTARYGVSRNTIREAIAHLLSNGLLEKVANKGVYVRRITSDDLLELFRLRELLEREAMVQIIRAGVIPADLARQVEQLEQLENSGTGDERSMDEYVRADMAFHQSIVAAAGSSRLNRLYETIIAEVMFCIYLVQNNALKNAEPGAPREVPPERQHQHKSLLEALEKEDPELATEAISRHMHSACSRYYQQLQKLEGKQP